MDDFFRYLGHLPRRTAGAVPMFAIGYFQAKDHRVTKTYQTFNVSCILAGRGDYLYRGVLLPVVAPCVLTQWPNEPMNYGPHGTWREGYLIFPGEALTRFRDAGLFDPARPVWSVANAGPFLALVEDLLRQARLPEPALMMDRIDRLAELAVVESCLAATPPPMGEREQQVIAIRERIDAAPPGTIDPEVEARRAGFSATTFRRLWQRLIGVPPARYATERGLREAARRLVDESTPIAVIANDLGFSDPLYFSRRFRAFTGVSPAAYRRRYRELDQR